MEVQLKLYLESWNAPQKMKEQWTIYSYRNKTCYNQFVILVIFKLIFFGTTHYFQA